MFDTVRDADCPDEYKMPKNEFVKQIIDTLEEYMPKFCELYHGRKISC